MSKRSRPERRSGAQNGDGVPPLEPGLYLVATPIGNSRDITLRAIDILRSADILAAEDTRTLRKLMEIHGIALGGRQILPYHDHNGSEVRPTLLRHLKDNKSVAYASDAGTPLVADPGFALARDAAEAGANTTTVPGPSAALAALSLSGLPSDRFLFAGFLPPAEQARRTALSELSEIPATLIFFETARRCSSILHAMMTILGDREAALCRELTKRFEEVRRGTLSQLVSGVHDDPPRGEIVIVVDRPRGGAASEDLEGALKEALKTMSIRDAAETVARAASVPRRRVYQMALKMSGDG